MASPGRANEMTQGFYLRAVRLARRVRLRDLWGGSTNDDNGSSLTSTRNEQGHPDSEGSTDEDYDPNEDSDCENEPDLCAQERLSMERSSSERARTRSEGINCTVPLDHDIVQLTKRGSFPSEHYSKCGHVDKYGTVSTLAMLSGRETNISKLGRWSSADCCHMAARYLPVDSPKEIDSMHSRVYVGRFSADGSLFVGGFQERHIRVYNVDQDWSIKKDIRARQLRWTVTDTALSQDQRFLVFHPQSYYNIQTLCLQGELEKALVLLFQLETAPFHHLYMALLKLCKEKQSLEHAHLVLAHIGAYQWDLVQFFGDFLVFILAKCGGLDDALHVLNYLVCRTVFAWTSIIAGFTECGQGLEALRMLRCMLDDGMEPDQYTFVSLLKACGMLPDIVEGRKLHANALEKDFTLDVYVGSTLVSMYGRCGNVVEAEWVFCGLSKRNIVTWNAMMSAYVDQGHGEKALLLYRQMREARETPTELTFVSALQAWDILASRMESLVAESKSKKSMTLELCLALHADARKANVATQVNLGNTLVNIYGKHGSIGEAQSTFLNMLQRDVVSWNALLLAYVDQEQGVDGLHAFTQLHLDDVSPDQHTFAIALQACCTLAGDDRSTFADTKLGREGALEICEALHADAERKGFLSDSFVVSVLVSLYGKCGLIEEAENLFLRLSEWDVVLWSSMLSAFVEQHDGERAIHVYRQMQAEGINADEGTLIAVLQACGAFADMEESADCQALTACKDICRALHAEAYRKGFTSTSVFNTLIAVFGRCGMIAEAEHVFHSLQQQNIVSWNALLSAYVEHSQLEKALLLYKVLLEGSVSPDELTYLIIFQACSGLAEREEAAVVQEQKKLKVAAFEIGQGLHMDANRKGHVSHAFVHNTLVHMYSKCGSLSEAWEVFNSLPQQDIVAWNAIISVHLEQGHGDKALQLYKRMLLNGVAVNKATLVYILQACNETTNFKMCRELHFCISAAGYDLTTSVANTLIHTYAGCALITDALSVLGGQYEPNVVSWNAVFAGYACHGNCKQYLEMQLMGFNPNDVTFLSIITACSHAGYVHEGINCFKNMTKYFSLDPEKNHYAVMIDLFGRAGDFKRLKSFMQKCSMEIDLSMWSRLLGACRTHSNIELAEWAFDHAVSLCPEKATSYVWMSNIYAAAAVETSISHDENLKERGGPWSLDSSVAFKSDIKESMGESVDLRERGGSWGLSSSSVLVQEKCLDDSLFRTTEKIKKHEFFCFQ